METPRFKLFPIAIWEQAKPDIIEFDKIFFTEKSREVRKVCGTVNLMKKQLVNGELKYIQVKKKARWDGFGRCWMGTHNLRKRDYDIKLILQ